MQPTCYLFSIKHYVYYMPMPAVNIDGNNDHDV